MKTYLIRLSLTAFLLCTTVAALNLVVDPFGAWELGRIDDLNRYKPEFTDGTRMAKPLALTRRSPGLVFLGSSRVGEGLSCAMLETTDCYNAALPGGTLYEALRMLQHLDDGATTIYLGLDFEALLQPERPTLDFSENRFRYTVSGDLNTAYPWQLLRDNFNMLLSTGTTVKSLQTVAGQQQPEPGALQRSLAVDGGWQIRRRCCDTEADQLAAAETQANGYRLIYNFTKAFARVPVAKGEQELERRLERYFSLLEQVIGLAQARQLNLQLFVNPSHAINLQALAAVDALPIYLDWLRRLQLIGVRERDWLPPVFDFSGYNLTTTSSLPETQLNRNFSDPVHYSHRIGAAMLAQMDGGCQAPVGVAFGRCLNSVDLNQYAVAFEAESERYKARLQSSGFLK